MFPPSPLSCLEQLHRQRRYREIPTTRRRGRSAEESRRLDLVRRTYLRCCIYYYCMTCDSEKTTLQCPGGHGNERLEGKENVHQLLNARLESPLQGWWWWLWTGGAAAAENAIKRHKRKRNAAATNNATHRRSEEGMNGCRCSFITITNQVRNLGF